jgi:ferredoxin
MYCMPCLHQGVPGRFDYQKDFSVPIVSSWDLCIDCGHCVATCSTRAMHQRSIGPEDFEPIDIHLIPQWDIERQYLASMNIAAWVGAFRVKFTSETSGSINLSELFPPGEMQAKVDQGYAKVDETSMQVESWWNGLNPAEQKNPINVAKYDAANKALVKASGVLTAADAALSDEKTASVQYSLDKTLKNIWNFVIGTQFQINRHFMLRAEYGFLGSRNQFIGGVQYRFGL